MKQVTPSLLPPSPRQELLERFATLLLERAVPLGLVAESDRDRLWERHVMDSLRALPCLPPPAHVVVDVGSGAGLPGVPVAVARPDCQVILVEQKARRAAFLELAIELLGLGNARVVARPAARAGVRGDVAVARALADPIRAWGMCRPVLTPTGRLLYFGGASWSQSHAARLEAAGGRAEICAAASFPWQGPVVMIEAASMLEAREHH